MSVRRRIGTVASLDWSRIPVALQREAPRFLVLGITVSVVLALVPRPPAVAQAPNPVLRILNSARAGCDGVGSQHDCRATRADRPLPPGYGTLAFNAYVARVEDPTDARQMVAYGIFRSYFRSRATDAREAPLEGLGSQARGSALSGSVNHTSGQRLDYQASVAITRGILFGAQARGEPGARRDLIVMMTPRISRAIDAENW